VIKTEKALKGIKADGTTGLIVSKRKEALDLRVSPSNLTLSLRIMDALIKAFEKRGWRVSLKEEDKGWRTYVSILEEELAFALWEGYERYEPVLTAAQKKEKEKYPWRYDRAHYRPTGRLSLRIRDAYTVKQSEAWADNPTKKVEERLNTFAIALIKAALREKAERIERKRREIEWEEQRKRVQELERRRWEEQQRLEKLEKEVASWNKSQLIRVYAEAVRTAAEKQGGDITPGSELDRWISWASRVAEWYDPSDRKAQELLKLHDGL
jgi:hypothetical protein